MIIYLGGAIHNLNFDEANDWRIQATNLLEEHGHIILNPLRGRLWRNAKEQSQFTVNEIVHRDLVDVKKADILLVNLAREDANYIGTTVEMTKARDWNKFIIVVIGDRKEYSPWVEYLATKICKTVEEACEYINNVLV